jgi:hypothetical protein
MPKGVTPSILPKNTSSTRVIQNKKHKNTRGSAENEAKNTGSNTRGLKRKSQRRFISIPPPLRIKKNKCMDSFVFFYVVSPSCFLFMRTKDFNQDTGFARTITIVPVSVCRQVLSGMDLTPYNNKTEALITHVIGRS